MQIRINPLEIYDARIPFLTKSANNLCFCISVIIYQDGIMKILFSTVSNLLKEHYLTGLLKCLQCLRKKKQLKELIN